MTAFSCDGTPVTAVPCDNEISAYYECASKASQKSRQKGPDIAAFDRQIEACFENNKCVLSLHCCSLKEKSLLATPQPCLDNVKEKANRIQKKCLSQHNPAAASVAQPLIIGHSDSSEYVSALDDLLNGRTEYVYQQKALEALEGLRLLTENHSSCPANNQEKTRRCLIGVFQAVSKPMTQPNFLLKAMDAEKQYDEHCADHKACRSKLSEKCHSQLTEKRNAFCQCLLHDFHIELQADLRKCTNASEATLMTPMFCEILNDEATCSKSFLETKLNIFDFDDDLDAVYMRRRRKRSPMATANSFGDPASASVAIPLGFYRKN